MDTGTGRLQPHEGDQIPRVDRCLTRGRLRICKMDGLHGIPLRDHYDDETAQGLEDITSLTEAGQRGWGVFTQNPRTRQVPKERTSNVDHRPRSFSLDYPNASKTLNSLVLGRHLLSIQRRASAA